ncbi:MAG: CapA family protein [Bacilli bacterium]|jgi:poly-gamma-glutamate synthesis protein (capsule biosynthesis protein)
MRRRKPNYKRIIGFFLFLCLITGGSICWFKYEDKEKTDDSKDPVVEEEGKEPKVYSLDMVMVGDALIHANVYNDAKVGDTYDFSPMFENVSDYFKSFDLAFYNQETPFGGKSLGYGGYPRFNTPSEIGDEMLKMGFNLVSLATNHTMDRGETGVINSLAYWNSKDVMTAGSYLSAEDRNAVNIKEKNGISYTMLAYTTTTNYAITSGKPYLLNMYDKGKVAADIAKVRDKVDLLMVSMHWGTEYATTPNDQQKEIATYLASLGVDIVIGTHTHSVQPIEYIDGTLVIYSLGNLISSQLYDNNLVGLMTSLKITKKVDDDITTINLSDLEAKLIFTYYKGGRDLGSVHTDHQIIPFEMLTADIFPSYKTYYEKYKKVLTSMDDTINVGAISE